MVQSKTSGKSYLLISYIFYLTCIKIHCGHVLYQFLVIFLLVQKNNGHIMGKTFFSTLILGNCKTEICMYGFFLGKKQK